MRSLFFLPDPERHFWVSIIKSMFRIAGFAGLIYSVIGGAVLLIIAEILGIVEEMV